MNTTPPASSHPPISFEGNDAPPPPPFEPAEHLQTIYNLVGDDAILLYCPVGEKGPRNDGWKETTLESSRTPEYQAKLAVANVAVLLGRPSRNLCAIDIDSDAAVEKFLQNNPQLKSTLTTRGARGCQIWVRPRKDYPDKILKVRDTEGEDVGEWRGEGAA